MTYSVQVNTSYFLLIVQSIHFQSYIQSNLAVFSSYVTYSFYLVRPFENHAMLLQLIHSVVCIHYLYIPVRHIFLVYVRIKGHIFLYTARIEFHLEINSHWFLLKFTPLISSTSYVLNSSLCPLPPLAFFLRRHSYRIYILFFIFCSVV